MGGGGGGRGNQGGWQNNGGYKGGFGGKGGGLFGSFHKAIEDVNSLGQMMQMASLFSQVVPQQPQNGTTSTSGAASSSPTWLAPFAGLQLPPQQQLALQAGIRNNDPTIQVLLSALELERQQGASGGKNATKSGQIVKRLAQLMAEESQDEDEVKRLRREAEELKTAQSLQAATLKDVQRQQSDINANMADVKGMLGDIASFLHGGQGPSGSAASAPGGAARPHGASGGGPSTPRRATTAATTPGTSASAAGGAASLAAAVAEDEPEREADYTFHRNFCHDVGLEPEKFYPEWKDHPETPCSYDEWMEGVATAWTLARWKTVLQSKGVDVSLLNPAKSKLQIFKFLDIQEDGHLKVS